MAQSGWIYRIGNACLPDGCNFIIYDLWRQYFAVLMAPTDLCLPSPTILTAAASTASGALLLQTTNVRNAPAQAVAKLPLTDIQNGDETGVDWRRSSCQWTTCDGIRNGVDRCWLRRPRCPACPTCDDGIKMVMKRELTAAVPCPPCGGGGCTPASVTFSLRGSLEGWSDGGDCRRYASSSRAWDGKLLIEIRDNSGVGSSTTSPAYDLSEYSSVDIEFFLSQQVWKTEDFWVRFNNGSRLEYGGYLC